MSSPQIAEAEKRIQQAIESNATALDLSGLALTTVPSELGNLINLTRLSLAYNQLTTVPSELGNLVNLTGLFLDSNQLTTVPSELGNLVNLTELDLCGGNQLTTVPSELENLINLRWLSLGGNKLITVPSALGNLVNLRWLFLDSNQLTTVPSELGNLVNLTEFYLSNNQLTTVPSELGNLINLTELYLGENQLTTVPSELGNLVNLTEISLSYNQLTTVPSELGNLANLTGLSLDGNPGLVFPSPEVVAQGTRAISAYLQDVQSGSDRQWLSKLVVVGEGGAGKTSLLRALRGEPFEAQQSSTHGIEIKAMPLAHPTEADVTTTLNTWDFGGQEIYHATHQFFLTNRSLFLLAFNARLGFEQGKLIYWLKTIRANAPKSPIIIVATYADERDADLPLTELKQQFPQIVDLYEISNKTSEGVEKLKQAVVQGAADLPLMGEIWPATWLKFANTVRKSEDKQTTPQQFRKEMSEAGVSTAGQPVLANWLHELGDILFFQDDEDVNDLVILKPQWVTEYISKVLTAEPVIKSNGIFTRQCMDEIWADLTPGLRDFFLRLMERFDLSYRTQENRDISLVVERLPFEPPDYQSLWQQKKQEANCREISMKFQLSEILPGIPTWFIARQHRFTIDQGERRGIHWRTGVLFRNRDQKHLALVRTQRDESTNADYLHLTVRGPVPHNFFDILREGLELTLHRYPGLKITRLLPCPDPQTTDCRHEFDYANLTKRLERTPPKDKIECPSCLEDISVTQLLFGIHYTTQSAVIERIDILQDSLQDAISEGFNTLENFLELSTLAQRDAIREIRTVQKSIESPCPTLFVLRPDGRSVYDFGKLIDKRLSLQLYCEHPGCFHPVQQGGLYTIENPRQWVSTMAPHLRRISGILKYVTPIIGPWVTVADADYAKLIKDDLDLTKALVAKLPQLTATDDNRTFIEPDEPIRTSPSGDPLRKVSGAPLRALHEFLKTKDPDQTWGNLERTTTPEGDVLWLCQEHIKEIYPTSTY